jgi:hypothetical protein
VQIQVVGEAELAGLEAQVRLAAPRFHSDGKLFLGAQKRATGKEEEGRSFLKNGENHTDFHQLRSEAPSIRETSTIAA